MILAKNYILENKDFDIQQVYVDEWNGSVFVRELDGLGREKIEKASTDSNSTVCIRALMAILSICDESGKLLFSMSDLTDMSKKSFKALDRIFGACIELNGLANDAVDAARGE
jgi:hypothetical protein